MTRPLGLLPHKGALPALPEPAARLLADGSVVAFSYGLTQSDSGAPSFDPGVAACVVGMDGQPVWVWDYTDIKALGIPDLMDAVVALQQPCPFSPFLAYDLWKRAKLVHPSDNGLAMILTQAGMIVEYKEWTETFHDELAEFKRRLDEDLPTDGVLLRPLAAFVLECNGHEEPSAHRTAQTLNGLQPLLSAWKACLPITTGWEWLADIPFALPTADDVRAALTHRFP